MSTLQGLRRGEGMGVRTRRGGQVVNVPVTKGAVCKLNPALVQLNTSSLFSS